MAVAGRCRKREGLSQDAEAFRMHVSYPTADEFKAILLSQPLDQVVREHLFTGTPYVFRQAPIHMDTLRSHIVTRLKIRENGIAIVGSAKLGFSMSPDAFPGRFSAKSDIDVVVVDEALYDRIWLNMLEWHYPRRRVRLDDSEYKWYTTRQRELYWGWFSPDKIKFDGLQFPGVLKPLRDISTEWFSTFRSLSLYQQFANRDINGRLYRTWDHAVLYHVDGLRQIRDSLRGAS